MLVGAPILIMFGLLNVTWVDGFPTFTFNRNKAVELRNAASQHINNLENQAVSQNWGQTTVDFLHAAQGPNHDHQVPVFPSTRPQSTSTAYNPQQSAYQTQPFGQQPQYPQQQVPVSYQLQQQYPETYQQQQQYPANYQQTYQQGAYPQTYQQQPYQPPYQQPYSAQPFRPLQQPTQQWPNGYVQQTPYQANTAAYGQAQQGGYPSQQYNYPLPSNQNQGQLGRY